MSCCLISLGSNLGDRANNLSTAIVQLDEHPDIEVLRRSAFLATQPAGGPSGQGEFLNAAVLVETSLSPQRLLALLQQVEDALGRLRAERWSARTIDLDVLLYDELQTDAAGLILPHPRMAFRRFVLEPAAQIAADLVHPQTGWTIRRLLDHLNTARDYIAIAGVPGTGKTALGRAVAERCGVHDLIETAPATAGDKRSRGNWDVEVELLAHRVTRLRQVSDDSFPCLSDFWLEQSLAYAELGLSPAEFERFQKLWDEQTRDIVQPKLLVFLEAPHQDRDDERLRTSLLDRVLRPNLGPLLKLDAREPATAVEELSAAIQAMQNP